MVTTSQSSTHRRSALRTVDTQADRGEECTIYEDEDGVVWHFMLNFTDLGFGTYGNNKFYMMQLLQDGANYFVFRKWGRVGAKKPQTALERYNGSLEKARASFQKKFEAKSGNEWPLGSDGFEKVPGQYVLVELEDEEPDSDSLPGDDDDGMADDKVVDTPVVPSKLHERVQDMLKLICDADLIEKEMSAMKLDLKRLPLGRLSKAQISQGYELLERMSKTVTEIASLTHGTQASDEQEPTTGGDKTGSGQRVRRSTRPKRVAVSGSVKRLRVLKTQLKELSNDFYSLIPHDFGRNLPPLIESMDEIKLKIDLLEVLADIEISQKLDQEKRKAQRGTGTENGERLNPLDAQYAMLNVTMEPLTANSDEFQTIQKYVETTHALTHVQYKLQISSILKITRHEEDAFADTLQSVPNHSLLWHGSRLCNMVGILAKGLRVAPPEAPSNGYMFGKGIYFADSVSKSANYCWTTPDQPRGVLVLAEVALGKPFPALEAEDFTYDKLVKTKQCDSLHGLGRMAAPQDEHVTMADGVVVPVGEFEPTGVEHGELLYNEFVVYRREQVKLRYLVALDFMYNDWDGEGGV